MNNNIINFGKKHRGKSYEWLFFNDGNYAQWLWNDRIYDNDRCFTPQESAHFVELMKRATHLGGKCERCGCSQVVRRVLRWSRHSGQFMDASFLCDSEECEWAVQDAQTDSEPSMFAPQEFSKTAAKKIVKDVKTHYIRSKRIGEKELREFFHNDANFSRFTPHFFGNNLVLAA